MLSGIALVTTLIFGAQAHTATAPTGVLNISVDRPGHRISPTLYGIFFEEINFAGDGGLYAELVRNGSLEFSDKPEFWSAIGNAEIAVDSSVPVDQKDPHSLRITKKGSDGSPAGASNGGYWGIPLKKGKKYRLSFRARSDQAGAMLEAALCGANAVGASKPAGAVQTTAWQKFEFTLTANVSDANGDVAFTITKPGTVWIDDVSLFPEKTWKDRPNGLRPDLANMLADLRPSFVRFPGGCWVEGDTMATSQRWKRTIGPVFERKTHWDLWGYMSGNGLGFHEYLQMCEDLGAEPLFVINCGMSHHQVVPLDAMPEYVQDALDAIEYANGPVTSKLGAMRAANGHPKPFGLKYMEIGNENGGPPYNERYPLFVKAIRTKYPEMHLVADVWGGLPNSAPLEIVDEHYYSSPRFFMDNATRYDTYDRKGPKVYVGEYAVTQGGGKGNLIGALGEAAFMTGMERNSDVVVMSSFAPLFARCDHTMWNPNLIDFDGTYAYGIPSYYVQQLFSRNRGDFVLPTQISSPRDGEPAFPPGEIALGTWDTQAEFKDVRVTQGAKLLFESADGSGLHATAGTWQVVDGALRQTSASQPTTATAGDPSWSDYTLTLKAKKLGGSEGFLIGFARRDDGNYMWWNVGGWGNVRSAIQQATDGDKQEVGRSVPGGVETGRWYDVKVDFQEGRVRCYLDGRLVQEVRPVGRRTLFATASRDDNTGDVIVKVVNASDLAVPLQVTLQGLTGPMWGTEHVLSGRPEDENSLEHPTKVKPIVHNVATAGPKFAHTFPAYSLTVMRLRVGR